jgi:putative MATE family efflux protein
MFVTIGMNLLNVLGNYLFIFGPFGIPVLGVAGVALSTVVSRGLGLLAMFIILYKRVGDLPFRTLLKFPMDSLKSILKIGVPSAGENLAYSLSQMMITYIITVLGTQALTTKVYAQNLGMFIYLGSLAVALATQIMVGHRVGAKQHEAAFRTCLRSLKIAFAISLGMAALFAFFREPLLGIFTDDPEIIRMGGWLIILTLLLETGRTFNLVIISSLKAAGDVKFPVAMGILSMFGVAVGLSYVLGIQMGMGLVGLWVAYSADEWFRGLLMLWRWRSRKWQEMSLIEKVDPKKATLSA